MECDPCKGWFRPLDGHQRVAVFPDAGKADGCVYTTPRRRLGDILGHASWVQPNSCALSCAGATLLAGLLLMEKVMIEGVPKDESNDQHGPVGRHGGKGI
jgi:hypothetical protein